MLSHDVFAVDNDGWRRDLHLIEKYQFIHHFVPHRVHKTRARLLSHAAFSAYIVLVLVTFALFRTLPLAFPGVLGYASDINVVDLFERTNRERVKFGFSELVLSPALTAAAEKKARHMFEKNYWAHIAPDGTEPWSFILDSGYDYSYAGENLAKNFGASKDVVDAWIKSSSHRQNLLSGNYDEVGFAAVDGVLDGYETTLVVQMFGRPRDASLVASRDVQDKLLKSYEISRPFEETKVAAVPSQVLPAIDVSVASRSIGVIFGGFVLALLAVDVWYSQKKGILKFTGHTLAHIVFLLFAMIGVLFVLTPGAIL
ncbi:hypothetical protein HYW61_01410 [candidate division WWE3 bacterium]|nr:hypothetical protein [candidate division WWE3 bacterium]